MKPSNQPSAHEEIDFLDRVERELTELTTAELEGLERQVIVAPAVPTTPKTVMLATGEPDSPAQAGTHTTRAANDENIVIATQKGYGSRPAPG